MPRVAEPAPPVSAARVSTSVSPSSESSKSGSPQSRQACSALPELVASPEPPEFAAEAQRLDYKAGNRYTKGVLPFRTSDRTN